MPKNVVIYEDPAEISKGILNGELDLTLTMTMKHGDWDSDASSPNTEVDFSAFSLEHTLNKVMEEKKIPITFKIRLK